MILAALAALAVFFIGIPMANRLFRSGMFWNIAMVSAVLAYAAYGVASRF